MDDTIKSLISSEEKVLWKGKRNDKILNFYLILGLIITILIALFYFSQGTVEHFLGSKNATSGSSIASFAILVGFVVSFSVYYSKQASEYVITDRKVIVKHGLISKRVDYAYHDKIRHTDISHGLMGMFFDVGTVYVDSGKIITSQMRRKEIRGLNMNPSKPQVIYYAIKDVENPKRVHNLIQRMVERSNEPKQQEGFNEPEKEPQP